MQLITNGKFYSYMTAGNNTSKYSKALKSKIEELGAYCLDNLNSERYNPLMMLGSIQSGKTRAFIGLVALCFDNEFDMTIILTKCSTALVKQTVSRMETEFSGLRTGNSTATDVVAQDILGIDFSGTQSNVERENIVRDFLRRYKGRKRIIVVKKQADNVDRMNMFVREMVKSGKFKRVLIVDDEADITSIGYEKTKGVNELNLRRISGAINTARKEFNSNMQHVYLQVTATPYALYLQPEFYYNHDIMEIKPDRTVVLPTGKGYIGGNYYFIDSEEKSALNYKTAKFLPHFVDADEMSILNGSKKNSGKNSVINDKRVVKVDRFLSNNYALPALRNWIFNVIVGAALVQLGDENNDGYYVSAVFHAAINKVMHKQQREKIVEGIEAIKKALDKDINDISVSNYAKDAYEDLIASVNAYGVLDKPPFDDVMRRIAHVDEFNAVEGLIQEIDVKEVNSDADIERLLDIKSGELLLENSLTIFVGGQVLDRGITIPNLISFFYGRDPKTTQQDTVMQHCRMFGYRNETLLSVTRFYTTEELFKKMREVTERDNMLRYRMMGNSKAKVVFLESGGTIVACSPQKILASKLHTMLPEKRYLPIGFSIKPVREAVKAYGNVKGLLQGHKIWPSYADQRYRKGDSVSGKYDIVDSDQALELIRAAYSALEPDSDISDFLSLERLESIFRFSLKKHDGSSFDKTAVIVRTGRKLSKFKMVNGVQLPQDAPDDGNNEGALAKELRKTMPVLVLTEQTDKAAWKKDFWWPIYYTPSEMNIGIYAEEAPKTGIYENVVSMGAVAMEIKDFQLINKANVAPNIVDGLTQEIDNICKYYNNNFKHNMTMPARHKSITCNIYLDIRDEELAERSTIKAIKKVVDECHGILEKAEFDEATREALKKYLGYLSDCVIDSSLDDYRTVALEQLSKLEKTNSKAVQIKNYIFEIDKLLFEGKNLLGYFIPTGSGNCDIYLYYNCVEEMYKDDDKRIAMLAVIAAHEMAHAWHYADVMTKTGLWIVRRNAYFRQGIVQETIAEFFALTFAKQVNTAIGNDVYNMNRGWRDIKDFPHDGGYSGALLISDMNTYGEIYELSLVDMPRAYDEILAPLAEKLKL